jgi:hypothetical protein
MTSVLLVSSPLSAQVIVFESKIPVELARTIPRDLDVYIAQFNTASLRS